VGFSVGRISIRFDSSSMAIMAATRLLVMTLPTVFTTMEQFVLAIQAVISPRSHMRRSFTMV